MAEFGRSPTFVVGSQQQQGTLDSLVRREQHFSEQYSKNKPLCFNAKAFQKTHPKKAQKGKRDADATLVSPMLVAVADGVSQIEEFGIDASLLPNEILNNVEELAVRQLLPGQESQEYMGPITMMREAYESSKSMGSTTVLTAVMDNSTKIHGKLHPMIAVCSIGDCEILILRKSSQGGLMPIFHTEMQRIDGHAQSPLQLARVDDSVDPNFDPEVMIEVIERGSAVHCVSAYEGDIVVLGSDGVFDNLFVDEIVQLCSEMLIHDQPASKGPKSRELLGEVARRLVMECHAKTLPPYKPCPIGKGGKCDDTSCVVGEVVEWTEKYSEAWKELRRQRWWGNFITCGGNFATCEDEFRMDDEEYADTGVRVRAYPTKPNGSFSTYWGGSQYGSFMNSGTDFQSRTSSSYSRYGSEFETNGTYASGVFSSTMSDNTDEDQQKKCSIM
jgi:protein phosphatase PTC7